MSGFTVTYNNPKKFTVGYDNPKEFAIGYNNPKKYSFVWQSPDKWWSYWTKYMSFLWTGLNWGDYLISSFIDRRKILITGRDFAGDYIPQASIATFKLQSYADFILDDTTDNLWFNGAGIQNSLTNLQLYGTDYTRTLIKFSHTAPYDITAIGILKSGIVLSAAEIDLLHYNFELWLFWSGFFNDFGFLKDNRILL